MDIQKTLHTDNFSFFKLIKEEARQNYTLTKATAKTLVYLSAAKEM